MKDAILRAKDRSLETRVERFQATAREMFRVVEEDPRDLTRARRYIGVYLRRRARRDGEIRRYLEPRARLCRPDRISGAAGRPGETGFSERTKAMMLDDKADLDLEIEVLRDRLNQDISYMTGRQS